MASIDREGQFYVINIIQYLYLFHYQGLAKYPDCVSGTALSFYNKKRRDVIIPQ